MEIRTSVCSLPKKHILNVQQEVVPLCTGTIAWCLIFNWSTSKVTTVTQNYRKCKYVYILFFFPLKHGLGSAGNTKKNSVMDINENLIQYLFNTRACFYEAWVFLAEEEGGSSIDREQKSHTAKVLLHQCCPSSYKEGRTVTSLSNLVQTSLLITQIRQEGYHHYKR